MRRINSCPPSRDGKSRDCGIVGNHHVVFICGVWHGRPLIVVLAIMSAYFEGGLR